MISFYLFADFLHARRICENTHSRVWRCVMKERPYTKTQTFPHHFHFFFVCVLKRTHLHRLFRFLISSTVLLHSTARETCWRVVCVCDLVQHVCAIPCVCLHVHVHVCVCAAAAGSPLVKPSHSSFTLSTSGLYSCLEALLHTHTHACKELMCVRVRRQRERGIMCVSGWEV